MRPSSADGPHHRPETDKADPKTLFDSQLDTQEFPARRYMLVLSGTPRSGVGLLLKDLNPPRSMSFADLVRVRSGRDS